VTLARDFTEASRGLLHDGVARPHLSRECLGDQGLLGREVAVQGGRAYPGTAGDLPHRDVQAFGGEQRAGRVEDELAVIPGIGAQAGERPGRLRRHHRQKSMSFATFSTDTVPAADRRAAIAELLAAASRGELRAAVHEVLPLEQAVVAHQKMEAGEVFGRIVLVP
jgi:hypothetical protein